MKTRNATTASQFAQINWLNRIFRIAPVGLALRLGAFLIVVGLLVSMFYLTSSASAPNGAAPAPLPAGALDKAKVPNSLVKNAELPILRESRVAGYESLLPVPTPTPVIVSTFASDGTNCTTTTKTTFNLADTTPGAKIVCATVTGAQPGWRLIWSNANFIAVQNNAITSNNQTSTFTLNAGSSLGDWRVIVFEPFGGSVQAVTSFTVIDAANPQADLTISKSAVSNQVAAGGQVVFGVQVTNNGPSDATNVSLTDVVPGSTTFESFDHFSGPIFVCINPAVHDTGTTTCTIPVFNRGDTTTFLATYKVNVGVSAGSSISNTVDVHSITVGPTVATPDPNNTNNTSTTAVSVAAAPCVVSCPSNITQPAASGQAGAVVTYSTPTWTGDCGQPITGENGETIPVISCNPASGSFFSVGTSTVICAAQTGDVCSFQVTVENPGGLSITLNGSDPMGIECGNPAFTDPGASAVNGIGQSVPVTITTPQGFNPDTPAAGSYVITYTATEGQNSVSTTRTVNVTDSQAPHLTLDGPNSITFSCGQPFVDPGVTASDSCDALRAVDDPLRIPTVSSSVEIRISFDVGPPLDPPPGFAEINEVYGPAPSGVDTNTPGKYRITYTATDSGGRTATAQRIVIVVPGGGTAPPNLTLIGEPQMTVECGSFTDPGATATVPCGGTVPVTTSGTVLAHTPGTYTITYTACVIDTNTNLCDPARTASVDRTVTVEDTTAPTITVDGANPMTVECHGTFLDPGATAHDACASDFPATASGTVDPNTVGPYTITYNATDPSGNAATPVTRTVNVVDTTAPTITTCPAPRSADADGSCQAAVPDFTGAAVATDLCGGAVTITQSPAAGTMVGPGPTTVTITARDIYNNSSTCQTTFTVNDKTPPTITLNGTDPNPMYVECHTSFTDPGATAHDNCSADFAATATGSVTQDVVGTYTITYNASDTAGNPATPVTRTVIVRDTTKPVITLNGANPQYVECHTSYPELGAVANDSCAGNFAATPSGSVNANVVGTYTITYNATDPSGNAATAVTRTVIVRDTLAPTITLNGQTPSMWPPNHKYQTFGVTNFVTGVNDTCDGTISIGSVVITKVTSDEIENGNGDGNTLNDIVIAADCKSVQLRSEREGGGDGRVYTIFFKVTDSHGNVGTATVKVVVQHNPGETAVDSGPHYTVTSNCP